MPGGFVCSASLKRDLGADESPRSPRAASRCGSCSRRSSARSSPSTHPEGLGSTTCRAGADLRAQAEVHARRLRRASSWPSSGSTPTARGSSSCRRSARRRSVPGRRRGRGRSSREGVDLSGEQQTKTKTALEFFSSKQLSNERQPARAPQPRGVTARTRTPRSRPGGPARFAVQRAVCRNANDQGRKRDEAAHSRDRDPRGLGTLHRLRRGRRRPQVLHPRALRRQRPDSGGHQPRPPRLSLRSPRRRPLGRGPHGLPLRGRHPDGLRALELVGAQPASTAARTSTPRPSRGRSSSTAPPPRGPRRASRRQAGANAIDRTWTSSRAVADN